jgi:4-coumarate--CoA ligase
MTNALTVHQIYGMTELTCAAVQVPGGIVDDSGSVGMLYPNMKATILNENGTEVGLKEPGELLLRGPNVCLRYWRNEKATKETIDSEGWLRTGDVAVVDERGFFRIVDRKKELIKVSPLQSVKISYKRPDLPFAGQWSASGSGGA